MYFRRSILNKNNQILASQEDPTKIFYNDRMKKPREHAVATKTTLAEQPAVSDETPCWRVSIPLDPNVTKFSPTVMRNCSSKISLKGCNKIAHDVFMSKYGSEKSFDLYLKDGAIECYTPDGNCKRLATVSSDTELDVIKQIVKEESCEHCNRMGLVVNVILKRKKSKENDPPSMDSS